MLYLTEAQVNELLTMKDALRELEAAFRAMGQGKVDLRPRQRVRLPKTGLNLMAAAWPERGYFGFKYYSYGPQGVRFWFQLFDGRTAEPLAILQADRLGQRRTGAASGVATKYLAVRDASDVGILGTGWQAESQLEALCAVRDVRRIRCHSPRAASRDVFAKKMSKALGVDVRAEDSARAAVASADLVVTATTASEPVLLGDWLTNGAHVNAMGANRLQAREMDDRAIRRCAFIAADSVDQARIEAGDLAIPIERGLLRWEWVRELGEVVTGKVPGRSGPKDITLFKSLGIALEDVAVGAFVYERARKAGVGTEVEI